MYMAHKMIFNFLIKYLMKKIVTETLNFVDSIKKRLNSDTESNCSYDISMKQIPK